VWGHSFILPVKAQRQPQGAFPVAIVSSVLELVSTDVAALNAATQSWRHFLYDSSAY
jgi:hypothetical protein